MAPSGSLLERLGRFDDIVVAALAGVRKLNTGAIMIYAKPSAQGFYKRLGAINIGEGPVYFSPEVVLVHFLYIATQIE
jgi:hypothetical protein